MFDGAVLKDNDTFSFLKIDDLDIIEAHPSSRGGGGIDMADISNEKGLKKCYFSKNAPKWNIITKGLNISGICTNEKCEAYEKEVDCQIGIGTFDLVRDADRIKCPICCEEIDPTTCVFDKCQYKFEGKKKDKIKKKTEYVSSGWKRVEKDFEYYDPDLSGTVTWLMLIIETKPLWKQNNYILI